MREKYWHRITIPLTGEFDTVEKIYAEIDRQHAINEAHNKRVRLLRRAEKRPLNARRDVLDLASLQFVEPKQSGGRALSLRRARH